MNTYTRVEYIENTGSQYIDTGIVLTSDTTEIRVVSELSIVEFPQVSAPLYRSVPNSGVQVYLYTGSKIYNQSASQTASVNTNYKVETITTATSRSISLNGNTPATQSFSRSISDDAPLHTFGDSEYAANNQCAKVKWKSQKIYKNGVLVRDFIPCLNSNGVACMYDIVTDTFFYNQGTGNFVAGPVIAPYKILDYIESNGTQYIDTGVAIDKTLRWEIDNEFTGIGSYGQGGSYNGCYDSQTPVCRFDIGINTSWLYMSYGSNNYITIDTQQNILNHRFIYKLDAKNMQYSYGQTIGTIPSYTDTASQRTKTFYLFARNDASSVDRFSLQKTYSSKIYQNDVLIQNLLPCINPNGVVGMYDTVTHTFFGNLGTGNFVAGPVIGYING